MSETTASALARLLRAPLPVDLVSARLPPVSALAGVDCAPALAQCTLADVLRTAAELLPVAPDLDSVALGAPGRLERAVAHHLACAALSALAAFDEDGR